MSILKSVPFWIIVVSFLLLIAAAVTYAVVVEMNWYVWLLLGLAIAGFIIGFIWLIVQSFRKPKNGKADEDVKRGGEEEVSVLIEEDTSLTGQSVVVEKDAAVVAAAASGGAGLAGVAALTEVDTEMGTQTQTSTSPTETKIVKREMVGNRIVTTETTVRRSVEPCTVSQTVTETSDFLTSLAPNGGSTKKVVSVTTS